MKGLFGSASEKQIGAAEIGAQAIELPGGERDSHPDGRTDAAHSQQGNIFG